MIGTYVAYDLETTGVRPSEDRIIEIGAVRVVDFQVREKFQTFVNPGRHIPKKITELTGITDIMVENAPSSEEAVKRFLDFCADDVILGHNLIFDYSFIKTQAVMMKLPFEKMGIDTLKIARKLCPDLEKKSLEYLCGHFRIINQHQHRAVDDALAAAELYSIFCHQFQEAEEDVLSPKKMEYHVKKQSPATEKQLKYLTDLIKKHNLVTEIDLHSLRKSEASRMIDQILTTYGR